MLEVALNDPLVLLAAFCCLVWGSLVVLNQRSGWSVGKHKQMMVMLVDSTFLGLGDDDYGIAIA